MLAYNNYTYCIKLIGFLLSNAFLTEKLIFVMQCLFVSPFTVEELNLEKLWQTIKDGLVGMWSMLGGSVEEEMKDFATMLFEKEIIGWRARKDRDYEAMMDSFIQCMATFTTVQEYQHHCSTLLDILADIGGPAKKSGNKLRDSWNTAVKDKVGIENFI